jgi:hypothetical protein
VSIDQALSFSRLASNGLHRIREGRLMTIRTLGGSQRVLIESLARTASAFGVRPLVTEFGGRQ